MMVGDQYLNQIRIDVTVDVWAPKAKLLQAPRKVIDDSFNF
jgi:hypothetical protein